VWAGVDSAWEQKKLEASLSWPTRVPHCVTVQAGQGKMLESRTISQRPVHALLGVLDLRKPG